MNVKRNINPQLISFFRQAERLHFKKSAILIRGDSTPDGVYLLVKGQVEQYSLSEDGSRAVFNLYTAPALFPMIWAFRKTLNKYYYEALTNIDVYRAPRVDVINFLQNNPDILFTFTQEAMRRMKRLMMKMEALMGGEAYHKLATTLFLMARQSGQKTKGNQIQLSYNQEQIADHAGITRETVSREMQGLKDKGIIDYKGRKLMILDMDKLQKELLM